MTQLTHFWPIFGPFRPNFMTRMSHFGGFIAHFQPFLPVNDPTDHFFGPLFAPFEPLFGSIVADICYSRDEHWPSNMILGTIAQEGRQYVPAMATVTNKT